MVHQQQKKLIRRLSLIQKLTLTVQKIQEGRQNKHQEITDIKLYHLKEYLNQEASKTVNTYCKLNIIILRKITRP